MLQWIQSEVLHADALFTIAGVVLLAFILLRLSPREDDKRILAVTGFFFLCILGLVVGWGLRQFGFEVVPLYLRAISIFGEGLCVIRLLGMAVFRVALPAMRLTPARILQDVTMFFCFGFWLLVTLRQHQVDLTGLVATSAVMTAILGLSMQDTLGNILGGIVIQFDESIQVGDWIRIDDLVGRVVEINWRHTAIETRNWETVIIPNSQLIKGRFLVLGRRGGQPTRWRRWIWFNIDYRFPPMQVIDAAEAAIRTAEIPNVARDPAPNCVFMEFAESYGRYALRYWLNDLAVDDPTDSMVRTHLYAALKRAGITLSMPAQAVFLTQETEERKAHKIEKELSRRREAMAGVELLRNLREEELDHLCGQLVPTPFVAGDIIVKQGAEAHSLYIIIDGRADVVIEDDHGHTKKVAELGPGSIFGEMGLLTGEPRRASVVARARMDCFRLNKAALQEILQARPEVAAEISALLAARRVEIEASREHLDAEEKADRLETTRDLILHRLRSFFGLD